MLYSSPLTGYWQSFWVPSAGGDACDHSVDSYHYFNSRKTLNETLAKSLFEVELDHAYIHYDMRQIVNGDSPSLADAQMMAPITGKYPFSNLVMVVNNKIIFPTEYDALDLIMLTPIDTKQAEAEWKQWETDFIFLLSEEFNNKYYGKQIDDEVISKNNELEISDDAVPMTYVQEQEFRKSRQEYC